MPSQLTLIGKGVRGVVILHNTKEGPLHNSPIVLGHAPGAQKKDSRKYWIQWLRKMKRGGDLKLRNIKGTCGAGGTNQEKKLEGN